MDNICKDMARSGLDNFNIPCLALNSSVAPVFNGKDYVLYAGRELKFPIDLSERRVVSIELISYVDKSDYIISVSGPNDFHEYALNANKYNSTTKNYIFNKGYNSLHIKYTCNEAPNSVCNPIQYYKIHVSMVGIAKTYRTAESLPMMALITLLIILLGILFRLNNNDSQNRPT